MWLHCITGSLCCAVSTSQPMASCLISKCAIAIVVVALVRICWSPRKPNLQDFLRVLRAFLSFCFWIVHQSFCYSRLVVTVHVSSDYPSSCLHRCVWEADGACACWWQPEGTLTPLHANCRWCKVSSFQPSCSGMARSQENPLRLCSIVSNQQLYSDHVVCPVHHTRQFSFFNFQV